MAGRPVRGDRHFVGRGHELAAIAAACTDAESGRGRLVVVRGAAGFGKTMLCEQAAARAAQSGFAVGWGRCWPDGGAPPLLPWPDILGDLAGPESVELLTGDPDRTRLDPDRFARFRAVGEVLADRARVSPLLVVLDDAHAADTAALLLTRLLVRTLDRSRLVMLITRRSGASESSPEQLRLLDEIEREATTLDLRPFDHHEAAALLGAHGLHVEDYGLAPALTRMTEGNPLLLTRAAVRASHSSGSDGIEHVIGDALDVLTPEHRDVVAVAALLGAEASASDVAALTSGDSDAALDALNSAASAGLMVPGPTGWAFTHDLVQRAALKVLTPVESMDLHARAVDLSPGDRPAAVVRRAHHALAAAPRSDADARRAVGECRGAARVLARGFEYERAAALLDTARQLAERLIAPAEYVAVLLEWADALLACGLLTEARTAYALAADVADDPASRARVALGLGGVWLNEHRAVADRQRVLALQRAALEGLTADEDGLRARLEVRLAAEAVYDGAPVAPVLDALSVARDLGDPHVLVEALSLTHHALLSPEHLDLRLPLAEELIDVASAIGDGVRVLFGLLWRAVDLYLLGDVRAERVLSELRHRADAVGCRSISYIVAAIDVMRLIRSGALAEAETAAGVCLQLGLEVGDADAEGYYAAHLLTIRWLQDREGELLAAVREVADSPSLVAPEFSFRATAATMMARAGLRDDAAAALRALAVDGLDALPRSSTWLVGIASIGEAARVLGDTDVASQVYALLLPFSSRPVMPSLAVSCFGSVEWPLGLAASTVGDAARAVEHLQRAVEANRLLGNRPLTLVVQADLAEARVSRGEPGDRATARDELRCAAEEAIALGMTAKASTWNERAAELGYVDDDQASGVLRRDGKRWVVAAGEREVVAPDLVGFAYLGTLLAHPGEEIPAIELCGGAAVDETGHSMIDREALDSYRDRVREIDVALEAAEEDSDLGRVVQLRDEREALRSELSTVLAVDGRPRRFVDSTERARTAVRKAIARAIDTIDASDDDLGAELRQTITTGRSCVYVPDPRRPRRWSVLTGR